MSKLAFWIASSMIAALIVVGCHADADDVPGQAEELADSIRRENAIANLQRIYSKVLGQHQADRSHAEVAAVADVIVEPLTRTYLDNPTDTQNQLGILVLLQELRDPRSLPALREALNWRTEVSEEHAISAAQTIQYMEVPEGDKPALVTALADALEKVTDVRPIDNRLRITLIRALGSLRSQEAATALTRIATRQSEEQNFLINRLAAQQVGELANPESVEDMIRCLFLFSPSNPGMRMNDVAAGALVAIGEPSLAPLMRVLRGEHDAANEIAAAYLEAVRVHNAQAARSMSVASITSGEATYALGALGFREALDPLLEQTRDEDRHRKVNAAVATVRINTSESDLPRVMEAIRRVYGEIPDDLDGVGARSQLIAASGHLYNSGMLEFYLTQARDTDAHPNIRIVAVSTYALLANKDEAAQLRALIAAEPAGEEGGYKENFAENEPILAAADACDEALDCWIGKLTDENKLVIRKAAYMIGRLGRDNAAAITALVAQLGHSEAEVRVTVVTALDRIATRASEGAQAAVDRIEELREEEAGRAVWNAFAREALPIQARLRARIARGG
ncbi:MAG: hypothetical protein OEY14_06075 [Myxococcales bacterium]|nr:hypothetical protein [Myxococcales bacterium]